MRDQRDRHLLDDLHAFVQEHWRCGDMDSAVEGDRVWMTCTCGAVLVRVVAFGLDSCQLSSTEVPMRLIGLAVVVFVNLAVASSGAGAQEKDRPEAYRIRPEDILRITVWKNDAMSGTVQVDPDGKISLPLLNQVQAAGLTAHELRDVLVEKLKEYESRPAVSVIVTGFRSFKSVWGLGVPLELDPTSCVTAEDVLNTLGFTRFEKGSKILILHPEGKAKPQIPFDYSKGGAEEVLSPPGRHPPHAVTVGFLTSDYERRASRHDRSSTEDSLPTATGTGWERTPWRATQRARGGGIEEGR